MEFDDILKEVNDFGPFQRIQWFFLFLTTIPQAMYSFAPVFSAMLLKEDVVTCNKANWTVGVCDKMNGVECPSRIYHTEYTSIVTDFDMFCDGPLKISMTKSIYYFGMLVGVYVLGWLSDRYGRLFALFVSTAIQFVASFISSFSVNYWMFLFLRFPIGLGCGANFLASFVLCTEMVGPGWRNAANLLVQVGFSCGIVATALLGYLIPKWQYFNLAVTLPNILFISYYWLTPESGRWQLARGLNGKSKTFLEKLAKRNKKQFPEHSWTLVTRKDNLLQQDEKQEDNYNFLHLFKTPYLRKITIVEIYCWFVTVLGYYGLSFSAGNLSGNSFANMAALGVVEIPALCLAAFFVNKWGRRIPLSVYYICGGVALLCILPIQITGNAVRYQSLILAFALIGKFTTAACFYQIYIHTAELYPTIIRTLGVGTASACARVGGIIAPIIVDTTPKMVPYLVFGSAAFVAGGLVLLLPETMGLPLLQSFEDEVSTFKHREDNDNIMVDINEKDTSVKNAEESQILNEKPAIA